MKTNGAPTADQIRELAERIRQLNASQPVTHEDCAWSPTGLERQADYLEQKQAEKAKLDKRIEELTPWLQRSYCGALDNNGDGSGWHGVARALLDRFPSLLDESSDK